MRGSVIALALVSAFAPAARANDDVDVPGLDAPDLRGDALVWEDATFYLEPWDGGAHVRFSTFGRGRREEVGRTVPVRIVSATRTFVEIEPSPNVGCAARRLELDRRVDGLRLFVKRDDLAPVLHKPYATTFSDGTSVKVAAGTPVLPTASGLYTIAPRGDKLRLAIPHAQVGYLFTNGKVPELERPAGALVRVDRMTSVKLGGDPFEVRAAWLAPKPAKAAEPQLLRWTARCVELVVSVPGAALRPAVWSAPYRSYEPAGPITTKQPQHVLRGTPLTTPSGREVAVAADVIDVDAPTGQVGACFEARLTLTRIEEPAQASMHRTTKLCASAAHVSGGARPVGTPAATRPPNGG